MRVQWTKNANWNPKKTTNHALDLLRHPRSQAAFLFFVRPFFPWPNQPVDGCLKPGAFNRWIPGWVSGGPGVDGRDFRWSHTLLGTNKFPCFLSTFESMMMFLLPGGICDRFLEGVFFLGGRGGVLNSEYFLQNISVGGLVTGSFIRSLW